MAASAHVELRGRDAALAAVRESLKEASAGRGRLVVISGEAGIGKTALAEVIGREAAEAGAAVIWGHAWEYADAPPYFPLWAFLRSLGLEVEAAGTLEAPFVLWEAVLSRLASATSA